MKIPKVIKFKREDLIIYVSVITNTGVVVIFEGRNINCIATNKYSRWFFYWLRTVK